MKLGWVMLIIGIIGMVVSFICILWCYLPKSNKTSKNTEKIKKVETLKIPKAPKIKEKKKVLELVDDDTMLLEDIGEDDTQVL